jgi:hypothetical protein
LLVIITPRAIFTSPWMRSNAKPSLKTSLKSNVARRSGAAGR